MKTFFTFYSASGSRNSQFLPTVPALVLSAFLGVGFGTVSAQNKLTEVGKIGRVYSELDYCPALFSAQGTPYIFEKINTDDESYVCNVYDCNMQKECQISFKDDPQSMEVVDLDAENFYDGNNLTLTQTLFNQDEKFEGVVDLGNGKGFSIVQDDGTVVFTENRDFVWEGASPYGLYFDVIKMGGKYYLKVGDSEYDYMYLINNESGTGMTYVNKMKHANAKPTVLERNTPITVDLKDEAGQYAVTVVSAFGRVVHAENVRQGQRSLTLDTSKWDSGLNVISVKGADGKVESCKVIIK